MPELDFLKKYSDRIEESKGVIKRFWNYEKITYTPVLFYCDPNYNLKKEMRVERDKYLLDKELSLIIKLKSIEEHLSNLQDIYIPNIDTFMGTPIIASAFGGDIRFFKDKDPWIKNPIINNYRDIDRLKKPDVRKTGLTKITIEFIDYWKLKIKEKIPISIPDIQGPLSVAIDLMGAEKFYLGLFDDPKRIHKILEIITEVIIDFLKVIYPKVEEPDGIFEYTGIFYPKGKGKVRISEDNLISLSPDIYLEFLQPYNEKILKEVGNGIIHWCGNGWQNFENVISTKNLTGIHNSSMGDMELLLKQIERLNYLKENSGKKIVYFSSLMLPIRKSYVRNLIEEQKKFIGIINHVFIPLDNFGLSFSAEPEKMGYREFIDKPSDVIREFLRK